MRETLLYNLFPSEPFERTSSCMIDNAMWHALFNHLQIQYFLIFHNFQHSLKVLFFVPNVPKIIQKFENNYWIKDSNPFYDWTKSWRDIEGNVLKCRENKAPDVQLEKRWERGGWTFSPNCFHIKGTGISQFISLFLHMNTLRFVTLYTIQILHV